MFARLQMTIPFDLLKWNQVQKALLESGSELNRPHGPGIALGHTAKEEQSQSCL